MLTNIITLDQLDLLLKELPFQKNSFTIKHLRNEEHFTTLALSVILNLLQIQTAIRSKYAHLHLH